MPKVILVEHVSRTSIILITRSFLTRIDGESDRNDKNKSEFKTVFVFVLDIGTFGLCMLTCLKFAVSKQHGQRLE